MHSLTSLKRMEASLTKEGLEYFLPKRKIIRNTVSGPRLELVPVLEYYIFVHAAHADIESFKQRGNYLAFMPDMTQKERTTLKVPDKEMDDFIRVVTLQEEKVRIYPASEIQLPPGVRIRIRGGLLDGVEGTLVKMKGLRDKRLVVSIPGVAHATVPVDKTLIQIL